MMYESAEKQMAWTLKVLRTEIKDRDDMCRTYSMLLAHAQEEDDEEDIEFWFNALDEEHNKRCQLNNVLFMIEHPDLFDQD